MTGLENQREFGNDKFSVSEQGLRHALAIVVLIAATLLSTEFFSVYVLYGLVAAIAVAVVIAFLVDIHHDKLTLDE